MRLLLKTILFILIFNTLLLASELHFTKEEQEFINQNKKVLIGSMNYYTPFSFMKNNQKVGFTHDLIEIISQKSGLEFEKIGGTWSEIFKYFQEGHIDMISEISYEKKRLY